MENKKVYIGKVIEQDLKKPFVFICMGYEEILIHMTSHLKDRLQFGKVTFTIETKFGNPKEILNQLEREVYGK